MFSNQQNKLDDSKALDELYEKNIALSKELFEKSCEVLKHFSATEQMAYLNALKEELVKSNEERLCDLTTRVKELEENIKILKS